MSLLKIGRPSIKKEKILNQLRDEKDIMKMNINIQRSFHKEIKRYALEKDITLTELISKALQEYMSK